MDDLKEKSLEGSEKPEKEPEAQVNSPEEKEQKGSFGDFAVRPPPCHLCRDHIDDQTENLSVLRRSQLCALCACCFRINRLRRDPSVDDTYLWTIYHKVQ